MSEIGIPAKELSEKILIWHQDHARDLPWKEERNPYFIWVSEIILQQTTVKQGIPYFKRFIKKFPTIKSLSSAKEEEVLALWQGLGYNSRARNLHKAAKIVMDKYGGELPQDAKSLMLLPGIGPYASAAISSFAFDESIPVYDANVSRILLRVSGYPGKIGSKLKAMHMDYLHAAINKRNAADFNQAIMDFGALQCTPKKPNCATCVFENGCVARQIDMVSLIPFKPPKKVRRKRRFVYIVYKDNEAYYLKKRAGKDIWEGMYEFPQKELVDNVEIKFLLNDDKLVYSAKQSLTHQEIHADFYLRENADEEKETLIRVEKEKIGNFALPNIIHQFIKRFNNGK